MKELTVYIEKMDCPTEEQLIRSRLKNYDGIEQLEFDLVRRELTIRHSLSETRSLFDVFRKLGLEAQSKAKNAEDGAANKRVWDRGPVILQKEWIQLGMAGALAGTAEVLEISLDGEEVLVAGIALLAILLGGREMIVKGWRAVRAFSLGINFLMTIAVTGALFIGEWPEAAMVTVLFALAEKIEAYALDRSRGAIRSLMELSPDRALVLGEDGDWKEVRTTSVRVGRRLRIRPGERIPLDGRVVQGDSSVNQAPITGESMPVSKIVGDEVFAGTINERGSLEVEVTRARENTTLARIIKVVQQAQAERGATQRFVDRFAQYYTPAVFVCAILIAALPPLLMDASFQTWFYRTLVLLVIACPCALVISTPVTVVSGLASAARAGILVKGGAYLESGHKLRMVSFDKTGTLTEGKPDLTDIVPFDSNLDDEYVLRVAASVDALSGHPVAVALVEAYKRMNPAAELERVDGFETILGRGARGHINGVLTAVGNHKFAHESGVCSDEIESVLEGLENDGKTAIVLFLEDKALAAFGVADTIRKTSIEAIAELHDLGLKTSMLTGDNQVTADAIAREAGIDIAYAELLPEDKLDAIDRLREDHGQVGMVGDGINDAPALAKADIGFAMGTAGTDTAIETADVALMKDDLRGLPQFIRLSRKTSRVLWQNITFAIVIKFVFFVLALAGIATLWMAVVADMGASLLVTFNGLRLLRAKIT